MQEYFYDFADYIKRKLNPGENFTAYFEGEDSDFCRFNLGKIRQSGHVIQRLITVQLIHAGKAISSELILSGMQAEDRLRFDKLLVEMRSRIPVLPVDPFLLYATEVQSSDSSARNLLPDCHEKVQAIVLESSGNDLVGIYTSGGNHRGFANSFGQRNWFSSYSFNFDWSLYHSSDKAVKLGYAGFEWDDDLFVDKFNQGIQYLEMLEQAPKTISPGKYRVFLASTALVEIVETLNWTSFGLKAVRSKQSPLTKMVHEKWPLNSKVSIRENIAEGAAPNFDSAGFVRPKSVELIKGGKLTGQLISPRSAKEFSLKPTGASSDEAAESIEMSAGTLPVSDALEKLGTGIFINNLWYLNYSDRNACRMTGMTRFACFWVENGEIVAPLNVMRFDDSIFKFLGDELEDLTVERDLILQNNTYWQRSTNSARLPGALIKNLHFTL